jgi:hypothetical protein
MTILGNPKVNNIVGNDSGIIESADYQINFLKRVIRDTPGNEMRIRGTTSEMNK